MLRYAAKLRLPLALLSALILSACTTVPEEQPQPEKPESTTPATRASVHFAQALWQQLPAAEPGSWSRALTALRQSCSAMQNQPGWSEVCRRADVTGPGEAENFFRSAFTPWRVEALSNGTRQSTGLMTGYYEPLLRGSRTRQGAYQYPLYGVPDDLIVVDMAGLYPQLRGLRLRGKLQGRTLVPYDTRAQIDKRTDLNRKAIVWVDDEIAAFFLQIQGSGRVKLPDGSMLRLGYADQNGHQYQSIGNVLIRNGELKASEASMQGIQAWARRNPSKVKALLAKNPSYVFFQERPGDTELGPQGAQGTPLTPQASVAVDRSYWKLGTVFYVSASQSSPALNFSRAVVAQDTGGAIRGPIRFDFFWGFGDEAGRQAGRQKSQAGAWVLVPSGVSPQTLLSH